VEDGFLLYKSLNAALVNTEPLSKTISLGMPCVANIDLRAVTVVDLDPGVMSFPVSFLLALYLQ